MILFYVQIFYVNFKFDNIFLLFLLSFCHDFVIFFSQQEWQDKIFKQTLKHISAHFGFSTKLILFSRCLRFILFIFDTCFRFSKFILQANFFYDQKTFRKILTKVHLQGTLWYKTGPEICTHIIFDAYVYKKLMYGFQIRALQRDIFWKWSFFILEHCFYQVIQKWM